MDEVHYLADKFRGAVWEEVIIHLPADVQVVSLSATVSNAEEFGGWLDTVRGDTEIVVSEHRPIPLWQHVMAGGRLLDLFAGEVSFDEAAAEGSTGAEQRIAVNPELTKLAQRDMRSGFRSGGGPRARPRARPRSRPGRQQVPVDRHKVTRPEMVLALDRAGLLPAIVFIFSRKGCDAAVAQCVRSGLALTTEAEAQRIEQAIDLAAYELPPGRPGGARLLGLARGPAARLRRPPRRACCRSSRRSWRSSSPSGLVKAVFATETLALGVNMPARSVVLEKLEKFNGEQHVSITAGEYTQLTGRAGRRGIDVEGHAVVLWQPGTDPAAVAGLASRRTYPLNSSFRPPTT